MGKRRTRARLAAGTLAAALAATGLAGTTAARATTIHPSPSNGAARSGHAQRGTAGIKVLKKAHRLRTVAHDSGLSPSALKRQLRTDPTMYVADGGHVEYHEELPPASSARRATTSARAAVAATASTIPVLHSQPGARQTIFLDFDGASISGTGWNTWDHLPAQSVPGWTDPAGTTAADIQSIWQSVAQDYAPFNVDVTTQDPGTAKLDRSWSGDASYGTHVVFTPSSAVSSALCQNNCGGLAELNGLSYDDASGAPHANTVFVFTQILHDVPKNLGEAAAHEAGHTWGLTHQGTGSAPTNSPDSTTPGTYYSGNGLWGPIMGDPYTMPITQWAKGEYPNANNKQDELAVMRAHGIILRADDGAGAATGAPPLPATRTGVITSAGDVDWYDLGSCAKGATVTVSPGSSSDLDPVLMLNNAAGARVATVTGAGATAAVSSAATTAAAHLFLGVKGAGYKTPTTGGYSTYGSIGSYSVTRSGCTAAAARTPSAPQALYGALPPHGGSTTMSWTAPASDGGSAVTGYQVSADGGPVSTVSASARGATITLSDRDHKVTVWAVNAKGRGAPATYLVRAPRKPGVVRALRLVPNAAQHRLTMTWAQPAGMTTAVTRYEIAVNGRTLSTDAHSGAWLSRIEPGYVYKVSVRAIDALGAGPYRTVASVIRTKPGRMYLHRLRSGARGGRSTIKVTWWPLSQTGDYTLAKYRIYAYKYVGSHVGHVYKKTITARKKSLVLKVPPGRYKIAMKAKNSLGWGPLSKRLGPILAR